MMMRRRKKTVVQKKVIKKGKKWKGCEEERWFQYEEGWRRVERIPKEEILLKNPGRPAKPNRTFSYEK
jgi:hypothetical protein